MSSHVRAHLIIRPCLYKSVYVLVCLFMHVMTNFTSSYLTSPLTLTLTLHSTCCLYRRWCCRCFAATSRPRGRRCSCCQGAVLCRPSRTKDQVPALPPCQGPRSHKREEGEVRGWYVRALTSVVDDCYLFIIKC